MSLNHQKNPHLLSLRPMNENPDDMKRFLLTEKRGTLIEESKELCYQSAIAITYSIFTNKSETNSEQLTPWILTVYFEK